MEQTTYGLCFLYPLVLYRNPTGDPDPLGRGQRYYQLNPNGDPVGITFLRYEEASDQL